MRYKGNFLTGLLAGTVAGAVAAMLLTPKVVVRPGNPLPIEQSDSGRGPRVHYPTSGRRPNTTTTGYLVG